MLKFMATRQTIARELEKRMPTMREGRPYSVSIRELRDPRSTGWRSQNHHIHGHATQIGAFCGDDKAEIIRIAKEKALTRGYPTTTNYLGEVIPESEAELDSKGAWILVEVLHEIAAFLGVQLIESSADKVEDHV